MNKYMKIAVEEAFKGMRADDGGPFGAVIVKDGEIIAVGHNHVVESNDPTAHAEIVAIRKASKLLGRFDLSDCEIYSQCEPCPMCFAAIHWAKMKTLYYGATRYDAADIGFDDQYIYDVIQGKANKDQVKVIKIDREECVAPFKEWSEKNNKV
ncbi:MAG: nucleoside deaminase, partial [Candidatus Izimaplasma sp.]|nr:nucleoside deaminase [Candidatus Izimaplasma bacterium]